jgi:hypothetical protein
MIMRWMDDMQALRALISTSSHLYSTFQPVKLSVLRSVLYEAVGDLLPFVCSATLARGRVPSEILQFRPGKRAIEEFEDILKPHWQVHKLPKDGAVPLLLSLSLVHNRVNLDRTHLVFDRH